MNARFRTGRRGAALVTAMVLMGILAAVVASLLSYAFQQRLRAISSTRVLLRTTCAETGLQYARAYFARNQPTWNAYLALPTSYSATVRHPYNPVASDWNPFPADPRSTSLRSARPELFADIDGDGASDVYIYVRDNDDEILPATADWARDNDQNVIVGAVCISSTLIPRRSNGWSDADAVLVESILSFNLPKNSYQSQGGAGSSGTGNLN